MSRFLWSWGITDAVGEAIQINVELKDWRGTFHLETELELGKERETSVIVQQMEARHGASCALGKEARILSSGNSLTIDGITSHTESQQ